MRMSRRHATLAVASTVLAGALPRLALSQEAAGVQVAGVPFPPSIELAGQRLLLNGAGVRYKLVVRIYAAALYLNQRASTPDAVLAGPGPKRLRLVMLRGIGATEAGRLFTRGLKDNVPPADFIKLIPATLRMGELFAERKRMEAGASATIDDVPGTGTVIGIDGKALERFEGSDFFNAMMKIWLGPAPADFILRDALLGQRPLLPVPPR